MPSGSQVFPITVPTMSNLLRARAPVNSSWTTRFCTRQLNASSSLCIAKSLQISWTHGALFIVRRSFNSTQLIPVPRLIRHYYLLTLQVSVAWFLNWYHLGTNLSTANFPTGRSRRPSRVDHVLPSALTTSLLLRPRRW